MKIENVDWQITSLCNRKCNYCFGPTKNRDLNLSNIYRVIDQLVELGTKQLGITGGEPLVYPYISKVIEYANNVGLKIYLSTNCDFYFKYSELIKQNVSIIGIPIDGANEQTHDFHRGKGSFCNITNALNDIIESSSNIKIKLGTVVTKQNKNELLEIEKYILKYDSKILFWKLYEVISYDRNAEQSKELYVDILKTNAILGQYFDVNRIVYDTINERNKSYFFIKPNGDVFIPTLNKSISTENVIGNILEDNISEIILSFETIANIQGYYKDYRYMKNN